MIYIYSPCKAFIVIHLKMKIILSRDFDKHWKHLDKFFEIFNDIPNSNKSFKNLGRRKIYLIKSDFHMRSTNFLTFKKTFLWTPQKTIIEQKMEGNNIVSPLSQDRHNTVLNEFDSPRLIVHFHQISSYIPHIEAGIFFEVTFWERFAFLLQS